MQSDRAMYVEQRSTGQEEKRVSYEDPSTAWRRAEVLVREWEHRSRWLYGTQRESH
jgi:hypothetical protein